MHSLLSTLLLIGRQIPLGIRSRRITPGPWGGSLLTANGSLRRRDGGNGSSGCFLLLKGRRSPYGSATAAPFAGLRKVFGAATCATG